MHSYTTGHKSPHFHSLNTTPNAVPIQVTKNQASFTVIWTRFPVQDISIPYSMFTLECHNTSGNKISKPRAQLLFTAHACTTTSLPVWLGRSWPWPTLTATAVSWTTRPWSLSGRGSRPWSSPGGTRYWSSLAGRSRSWPWPPSPRTMRVGCISWSGRFGTGPSARAPGIRSPSVRARYEKQYNYCVHVRQ